MHRFYGIVEDGFTVPVDILIVAAHLPELEGLRSSLGDPLQNRMEGIDVVAKAVGIGLPAAAAGTAMLLQRLEPKCVVLVGTCGAYDAGCPPLAVGQVVVGEKLHLVSTAVVEGRGEFPGVMSVPTETHGALSRGLAERGTRLVAIATTLAITTDDVLARRIADVSGCEVEHLEALSVGSVCAQHGVPAAVALAVANRVGARARDEWRRHHVSAGNAATAFVAGWLARGAPGAELKRSR
jgi:nucleoside phosphorylase